MKEKNNLVYQLSQYIEAHLEESLDLDRIAEVAGYSKFYLSRMFAEETGCTLYQYIKKRRLTEAARKLVYTQQAIMEIALEANYESQQAFTYAFHLVYQKSPEQYRKEKRFYPVQKPLCRQMSAGCLGGVMAA